MSHAISRKFRKAARRATLFPMPDPPVRRAAAPDAEGGYLVPRSMVRDLDEAIYVGGIRSGKSLLALEMLDQALEGVRRDIEARLSVDPYEDTFGIISSIPTDLNVSGDTLAALGFNITTATKREYMTALIGSSGPHASPREAFLNYLRAGDPSGLIEMPMRRW